MSENETQRSETDTPDQPAQTQRDAPSEQPLSAAPSGVPAREAQESTEAGSSDAEAGQRDQPAAEGATDEGDIAADYLEELLDIVDLDGDIDIEVRGGRTYVSIVTEEGGEELDDLVGDGGDVLDALQELTRLAVLTATGERTRLILDIAGHRDQRQDELKDQAEKAIAKVKDRGEDEHLEPMSAYERKIVHDFVAESGLLSESEGEGKRRHVVISPA
ncbi:RNA-binding protein [Nesterenkonia sp. E16_7]|uniref:Jag family protein n=1 Tax=unclassified Nesterenkonia TaxID=2629769 RepID=UPI001A929302|nr:MULTISPECIES: R3H domain-containing nucleic acid-binding protein [unclassified Nesterenkonia]MBO0594643.1 RNA-binding protein [Nesterenkonia sp. E16_10]MBO0598000.1 RNA-binding protein [Nesterenkonia sp. E16_7]